MSDLTLDETAVHLHELYSSFNRAGFTEEQSFELVKVMVRGSQAGKSE